MKKVYLLLILSLGIILTGCTSNKSKEVKSLDDFNNVSTNNGFTVSDNMNTYQDKDYITGASIATLGDITIEMVTYDNNESAKKTQDNHIDVFKSMKGSGAVMNSDKGKNYYKYDMVSNGYYMVSERVENTLIFSKTQLENKDKIETILNELGY